MTSVQKRKRARTFYDILGVSPGAMPDEIKQAYYAIARREHPDVGGNAERFKEATLAWAYLRHEGVRSLYDKRLRLEGQLNCGNCSGLGISSRFSRGKYQSVSCVRCGGTGTV